MSDDLANVTDMIEAIGDAARDPAEDAARDCATLDVVVQALLRTKPKLRQWLIESATQYVRMPRFWAGVDERR